MGSPTILVQHHQIIKIRKISLNPTFCVIELTELLRRILNKLHVLEIICKLLKFSQKYAQFLFCIESDKPRSPISQENFNGIHHLTKLTLKNFFHLTESNLKLTQILFQQIVFRSTIYQINKFVITRPIFFWFQLQFLFIELPLTKIHPVTRNQLAIVLAILHLLLSIIKLILKNFDLNCIFHWRLILRTLFIQKLHLVIYHIQTLLISHLLKRVVLASHQLSHWTSHIRQTIVHYPHNCPSRTSIWVNLLHLTNRQLQLTHIRLGF